MNEGGLRIAIREAVDILKGEGCTIAGVLVAMDRQEKAPDSDLSAIQGVFLFDDYSYSFMIIIMFACSSSSSCSTCSSSWILSICILPVPHSSYNKERLEKTTSHIKMMKIVVIMVK